MTAAQLLDIPASFRTADWWAGDLAGHAQDPATGDIVLAFGDTLTEGTYTAATDTLRGPTFHANSIVVRSADSGALTSSTPVFTVPSGAKMWPHTMWWDPEWGLCAIFIEVTDGGQASIVGQQLVRFDERYQVERSQVLPFEAGGAYITSVVVHEGYRYCYWLVPPPAIGTFRVHVTRQAVGRPEWDAAATEAWTGSGWQVGGTPAEIIRGVGTNWDVEFRSGRFSLIYKNGSHGDVIFHTTSPAPEGPWTEPVALTTLPRPEGWKAYGCHTLRGMSGDEGEVVLAINWSNAALPIAPLFGQSPDNPPAYSHFTVAIPDPT